MTEGQESLACLGYQLQRVTLGHDLDFLHSEARLKLPFSQSAPHSPGRSSVPVTQGPAAAAGAPEAARGVCASFRVAAVREVSLPWGFMELWHSENPWRAAVTRGFRASPPHALDG